jgi:hypothetical protein
MQLAKRFQSRESGRKWKYYAVVCPLEDQEHPFLPFWIARVEEGKQVNLCFLINFF